jgi:hypothetical protein
VSDESPAFDETVALDEVAVLNDVAVLDEVAELDEPPPHAATSSTMPTMIAKTLARRGHARHQRQFRTPDPGPDRVFV